MSSKDKDSSLYIRAIQGPTSGNLMAPVLLRHVALPYNWKESMFHKGSSFDCTSILKSGLVAGGRTSKDGRLTLFFAPLNPTLENEPGETLTSDDFTKPRMEHYRSKWRTCQCAVYWVNLARAQDEGLQFWQRWSNAIAENSSLQPECIYKVLFSKRRTSFVREHRDASTSTKSCTQKFLANAAAATAAARHFWECIRSQRETVCRHFGEGRDEKESRQLNRGVRNFSQQETVTE